MVTKSEEIETEGRINVGLRVKKEECLRCLEFQDNITKANEECAQLKLDIGKKNSVIEWLEGKLGIMELKKLKIVDEVRMLKQKNEDLEKGIRNCKEEEEDKVTQLIIENKVLECEKNKAEIEIDAWKVKCKELEMQVMELQKGLLAGTTKRGVDSANESEGAANPSRMQSENKANENDDASGTPPIKTTGRVNGGRRCELKSSVKKCLDFAEKGSSCKNMYPATPGGKSPLGPIEISDSDDDINIIDLPDFDSNQRKEAHSSNDLGLGITQAGMELTPEDRRGAVLEEQSDEDDVSCYNKKRKRPYLSMSEKRRVSKIVTSESESDIDDNVPICKLRRKNLQRRNSDSDLNSGFVNEASSRDNFMVVTPRRRLIRRGNSEGRGVSGKFSCKSAGSRRRYEIPKTRNGTLDEDETEEDESESESLGGFIVNSSDSSATSSSSDEISEHNDISSGDSDNASDDNMGYDKIISSLRRDRKDKMNWEYEADMLADIAKSPALCMKAVCAIYRQQTSEERSCKATINLNGRGFSQIHAFKGSNLAEFLTDGDPEGDVKKSVEELQEFNRRGVELCRNMATHYSKQLFEIYENEEDPFFQPQSTAAVKSCRGRERKRR